ncbi:arginine--tRNA ligase [Calorimonas adulescens]|uniref:Arginine--tRNA ligase n=1 Tax=Calorimonas adulescens TaxID=2606906 RepID=A0A5D8QEE6_9THEO|nr:arginine--tRNA ligase [Calorimonas adulescens]TZE82881.1 arginine--tRNA ligase [Calorimonas adulescens]
MYSIFKIHKDIKNAIKASLEKIALESGIDLEGLPVPELEVPKDRSFGDYATNVAMTSSKIFGKKPRELAELIVSNFPEVRYVSSIEIAGPGFINFKLDKTWLYDVLREISSMGQDYGNLDVGKGERVQIEFVSANPTGPMHLGNARGGAIGDVLASIMQKAGYYVEREFYINDAGNQVEKFGASLEARYLQLLGRDAKVPEDGYHGEDLVDLMREYIEEKGESALALSSEDRQRVLREWALEKNINRMHEDLEAYGIHYDVWFRESSLYESGEVDTVISELKANGYTYDKDGALWFKATEFGADKDDVLVRANGIPTYFASDIAYHRNKFVERGFDRVIDIWGADHAGHVGRMKAAMKALGIEPDRLTVILMQLVRLKMGGEFARMSKRKGNMVTLRDLVDAVGRDAVRFLFNMRSSDSQFEFDMDLAIRESSENPVFYAQYAHARICSILRNAESIGITVPDIDDVDLYHLNKDEEFSLMEKLASYPEEIGQAALRLEPYRLTHYALDLATLFHSFYTVCRVIGEEEGVMKARLVLIDSTRKVLANALAVLGVSAPEKM